MSTDPQHPYSLAVVAGGLVFVSGSLPVRPDGTVVSGGRAAVDAALDTMERRMSVVGARLADVVKLTYFVTDMSLRDAANEQFIDRWPEPRPARTVVGVASLPYGCEVEIDAIVRAPGTDRADSSATP